MREISIPPPAVRFPEDGWRERIASYVAKAASAGLDLEVDLHAGAPDHALAATPSVHGALRSFLAGANGGRIGHLHVLPANAISSPLFASDLVGSYDFEPGGGHEVAFVGRDGPGEQRFSTLGAFLDCALVRAWADAAHRKAEVDAGDDLDDRPWIDAARALELRIDPKMIRTRED